MIYLSKGLRHDGMGYASAMIDTASATPQRAWHHPGNFTGAVLLALLLLAWFALPGRRPDMGDWSAWAAAAAPLVIAAIAQSQIVLAGGQGLAAGSTALLVNALVTTHMAGDFGSMIAWSVAGILLGGAIGAVNGLLVGFLRLPSTAVTIATSFTAGGITLALTGFSPPASPERFRDLLTGEILPGLPVPILLTLLLLAVAVWLDGSRLGREFRKAGAAGWSEAADRRGPWVALAYVIGGLGYGLSGVFLAAEIGMSDPTTSGTSLLEIYAAVALGGSVPYMRQGSNLGAAIAALAIAALGSVILRLGLPDYATPALIGLLLLAGLWQARKGLGRGIAAAPPAARSLGLPIACFGLPLVVIAFLAFGSFSGLLRLDPLLLILVGLLAFAQAWVVASGHLDLSLSATMAVAGLAAVALTQGSDAAMVWALPLILAVAVAIGLANGALGLWLRGPRVLVTLAATGFLNALSVYLAFGWPNGFAPAALMDFMSPTPTRTAPAVLILGPLLLIALALLATPLARRWLRGLGQTMEPPAARRAAPLIHGFAALLAAGVGIMLAGYGGQAPISAAEPFTLPSLLAIETAGLTVGRRGGNPALLILAVPMVTLIDMLMLGTGWSYAARVIVMGVLLLAVVTVHGLHRRLRRCAGNADGLK